MSKVTVNIQPLMDEAGINQIDLSRETRLAVGTVSALARGLSKGIQFQVLARLCDFFTVRLGRPVRPADILFYRVETEE